MGLPCLAFGGFGGMDPVGAYWHRPRAARSVVRVRPCMVGLGAHGWTVGHAWLGMDTRLDRSPSVGAEQGRPVAPHGHAWSLVGGMDTGLDSGPFIWGTDGLTLWACMVGHGRSAVHGQTVGVLGRSTFRVAVAAGLDVSRKCGVVGGLRAGIVYGAIKVPLYIRG